MVAGALKMLDVKMTDMKLTDQCAGHEIAGHENDGRLRLNILSRILALLLSVAYSDSKNIED